MEPRAARALALSAKATRISSYSVGPVCAIPRAPENEYDRYIEDLCALLADPSAETLIRALGIAERELQGGRGLHLSADRATVGPGRRHPAPWE